MSSTAVQFACGRCGRYDAPLTACELCRSEHYCSEECRVAAWPAHEQNCLNIVAYNEGYVRNALSTSSPEDVAQGEKVLETIRDCVSASDPITGTRLTYLACLNPTDLIQIQGEWDSVRDITKEKCANTIRSVTAKFFNAEEPNAIGTPTSSKHEEEHGLTINIVPRSEAVQRRLCTQTELEKDLKILFVATIRLEEKCSFSIAFGC